MHQLVNKTLMHEHYVRAATAVHAMLFAYACVVLQHPSVTSISPTSRVWPSHFNVRLEVRLTRFPKVNNKLPTTEVQFNCHLLKKIHSWAHLFRVETKGLAFHLTVHLCITHFFNIFCDFATNIHKTCAHLLRLFVRLFTAVTRDR